jgi:hypothetical protein
MSSHVGAGLGLRPPDPLGVGLDEQRPQPRGQHQRQPADQDQRRWHDAHQGGSVLGPGQGGEKSGQHQDCTSDDPADVTSSPVRPHVGASPGTGLGQDDGERDQGDRPQQAGLDATDSIIDEHQLGGGGRDDAQVAAQGDVSRW